MIKYVLVAASIVTVGAFGLGTFVGWKTSMKAIDAYESRRRARESS